MTIASEEGTVRPTPLGRTLFVMAARAEYRAGLSALVDPFFCGVGPVEAAVETALRVAREPIDAIVSLGSAGSARLPVGTVREIASVAYRDMDASPFGFEPGVTPFAGIEATVALEPAFGIETASLSTGAAVVSGDAYAILDADMVDMETWALVRLAQRSGIRLAGLRGVSDGAAPVSRYEDWTDALDIVDDGLARVLARWLRNAPSASS